MDKDKDDKISRALGLPSPDIKKQLALPDNDKFEDIDVAKDNIKEMITRGKEAVDDLLTIAQQSQHPRAFEVLANLLRTVVDANKDLVDINVRENKVKVFNDNRSVQQQFFFGTTNEMLKQIKGTTNSDNEIEGEIEED
jgi:hypothetical protein